MQRLCYSLVSSPTDGDDVVQDSFIYAFRNLHRYDSQKSSFRTWLYMITVSRCRNVQRQWRPVAALSDWVETLRAPLHESPESQTVQREAEQIIWQAIHSLPDKMAEAIILRYGHNLTYREMAEVLACPQKTAESRGAAGAQASA